MKLKDLNDSSALWSTPTGALQAGPDVADGILVDASRWGASIIGVAVECSDGRYFGSIRVQRNVYDRVFEFLKRSHGKNSLKPCKSS